MQSIFVSKNPGIRRVFVCLFNLQYANYFYIIIRMNIIYLKRDLSKDQADAIIATGEVAVDTELTGLDVKSDRLCLVQLRGVGDHK